MKAVLALDQGTTGSTALVIGEDGAVRGRGYCELPQYFPAPGQVEHDPEDMLHPMLEAAQEAIARAGVPPVCVGSTNQRETVCVWDRVTGRPLHRTIVWQDRRTAPRCAEIAADLPDVGVAAGGWRRAADFLAGRHFDRFTPVAQAAGSAERARECRRAVGTALQWAAAGPSPSP